MGWLLGGWLGAVMGNDWVLLLTGSLNALIAYSLVLSHREFRRM